MHATDLIVYDDATDRFSSVVPEDIGENRGRGAQCVLIRWEER